VGLAALDVAPIALTAVTGSLALVLSGCLSAEDAYGAVNWKIIFLLAGLIPLGTAMEVTGASTFLADNLVGYVSDYGVHGLVGGFFGLTMLLTNVVSNAATAVLLAPVAISAANSIGIDPRPVLVAVTFGASLSFMTPIGYQTNTLVFGPGRYSFGDFAKFGTPLNVITLVLVTILIPIFWPA
jgi:di/tricarboxylate transporter